MVKTFKFKITIRVLLLTATTILLAFLLFKMNFVVVSIAVGLLLFFQVFSLIHFTEKTNKDLSRFFLSIKYDDTSQAFTSRGLGSSFNELKDSFNNIVKKLQETRSEREARTRYLNTIIQHVGVGLIAIKIDGSVDLINNSAKKILRITSLRNINDIQERYPNLIDSLVNLKHKEKKLVKIQRDNETGYLSLFGHKFILREEELTLVSIQNIQEELEEKEMEAWQNLIRVLTHEIMNSITPISSMTSTILDMLRTEECDEDNYQVEPEDIKDMVDALRTIHNRSQGLMNFVSNYRNLTLIQKPRMQIIPLSGFFQNLERFMKDKLSDNDITLKWSVTPESLELSGDPDLMEQVMINLLLNAVHAVSGRDDSLIEIAACLGSEGAIVLTVKDNGVGIVEEALDKIFIPFFTTKENGSGIGLSLSRQIIRLHKGTLRVSSVVDEGSTFTLRFA